jgi:hypothetical protein
MDKQRSRITTYGGIGFVIILISSSIQTGHYYVIWMLFVSVACFSFLYFYTRKKYCNQNNKPTPYLMIAIMTLVLCALALMPLYLKILIRRYF